MNEMEGKDTGIVKNAREYGELSNDNPLKWKHQTTEKTKPPPSNPPLDPEDHNNNNSNNNSSNINNSNNNTNNKDNNNNNVNEEGGCISPQEEDVGVEDLLQTSKIEDIDELPHDDGPAPNQVPGKGVEDDEEFSLPTSLSSQDDGGHCSPSTGLPDDEGGVKQATGLLVTENDDRRYNEGNEMFSMPKSLLSHDGGHGGGTPPYLSMTVDEGSVKQIMTWQKINMSDNRECSMPKSLSSQIDGILPHPFMPNFGIHNFIPNVKYNNKKAIKKAKKKARANASRMFKRPSSKRRGRVNQNAEKHIESLKNAFTELKRDVILIKEKLDGLDHANNGNDSIIPLQIVYMLDDMKNMGREFTRVYLPQIIGYIMFGSAMAALGYMQAVRSLED